MPFDMTKLPNWSIRHVSSSYFIFVRGKKNCVGSWTRSIIGPFHLATIYTVFLDDSTVELFGRMVRVSECKMRTFSLSSHDIFH